MTKQQRKAMLTRRRWRRIREKRIRALIRNLLRKGEYHAGNPAE
jgi:hypothetical protein